MSQELNALIIVSISGLLLVGVYRSVKTGEWRLFGLELGVLVVLIVFLNILFGFPNPPVVVEKGSRGGLLLAAALYLCMLLGMVSQYVYNRFEKPRRWRTKWDWGLFLAPVFASPIVFIPLFAAIQDAGIDLRNAPAPRLMIFFVAFQNGFFWKEFFDRKRKEDKDTQ